MGVSELRERVAFEKRSAVDDGSGNSESGAYVEQFRCAAQIEPMKGTERVLAARLAGISPVTITIRYSKQASLIGTSWRITNTRTGVRFNIRSDVNADQHKRFITIVAESGVAT